MEWIKSSTCSADQPMCIEIAEGPQELMMRGEHFGPAVITRDELREFVAGAKKGDFDHLT